MTYHSILNLTFAIFVAIGIIPTIIVFRVHTPALRKLSLLLGRFALVHGFYHPAYAYGQSYLAGVVLGLASIVLLPSKDLQDPGIVRASLTTPRPSDVP